MLRLVRSPATPICLLAAGLLVPVFFHSTAATALATPTRPATVNLQVALIRCGLDADALAAVGATTNQLSTLVGLATTQLGNAPLEPFDSAVASAQTARDAAQRKIQSGLASPEEVEAFPGLESTLASAVSARDTALTALFTAAAANLNSGQRTTLAAIRANRSWKLPIEFLTFNREEVDWVELRNALANERVAAKNSTTPNSECQTLLATERARTEVAAAKTAYDSNIATLRTAFNSIGE
jgi:hypothetical protein